MVLLHYKKLLTYWYDRKSQAIAGIIPAMACTK